MRRFSSPNAICSAKEDRPHRDGGRLVGAAGPAPRGQTAVQLALVAPGPPHHVVAPPRPRASAAVRPGPHWPPPPPGPPPQHPPPPPPHHYPPTYHPTHRQH